MCQIHVPSTIIFINTIFFLVISFRLFLLQFKVGARPLLPVVFHNQEPKNSPCYINVYSYNSILFQKNSGCRCLDAKYGSTSIQCYSIVRNMFHTADWDDKNRSHISSVKMRFQRLWLFELRKRI